MNHERIHSNLQKKGNKEAQKFETSLTANTAMEARAFARLDLDSMYTIVSVTLS